MTAPQSLLVIDDDERLADLMHEYLSRAGYFVERVLEGAAGLAKLRAERFDLVILDLMLPDMDGLDVCRQIRNLPEPIASLPVLILTAKNDPMDRVIGLELGADDYLAKPFEPRELLARVRTVLRRQRSPGAAAAPLPAQPLPPPAPVMNFGAMEIDCGARLVRIYGKPVALTGYQFDLLAAMAMRAGQVLSRQQLLEMVRGGEVGSFDRSIDVHMGRLRSIIEPDVRNPKRILTVRGLGYIFVKHQT
ncbi:MAG: response regulator transcription factor [Burkholderiaceae bacterium]|jgi:DNA-binding response OmpR family regulator|nr:response regulator transcription factor [Burkholderiaceae bacterium]